jgi:hypothetical protein
MQVLQSTAKIAYVVLIFAISEFVIAEPKVKCGSYTGDYTSLHRSGGVDADGNGMGSGLCWDNQALRLIGYYSFDVVTRDEYDYTSYLNSMQLIRGQVTSTSNGNHGVNFTRINLFGGSNTDGGCLTGPILDPAQPTTRMPLKTTNGGCSPTNTTPQYSMCVSPSVCGGDRFDPELDTEGLDDVYFNRLKDVLRKAKENGVVVELILFDRLSLAVSQRGNPRYFYNPMNPFNNNMDDRPIFKDGKGGYGKCTILPVSKHAFDPNDALPEFFDICHNKSNLQTCKRSLNCLGLIQKKYVQKVVTTVKQSRATNVFLEIMNEAHLDDNPTPTSTDWKNFALWHEVVADWIKKSSRNELLVSGSILAGVEDQFALMSNCTSKSTCNSEFRIFYNDNLDIVTLQGRSWMFVGPCTSASMALKRFGKPVIIDTDGINEGLKKDQCKILNIARDATVNDINGSYCRRRGEVHFNHIDGMTFGKGSVHESYLDCQQLDLLGDLLPSPLSDVITPGTEPARCGSTTQPISWKHNICPYKKAIP